MRRRVEFSDNESIPRDSTWRRLALIRRIMNTPQFVLFSRTVEQASENGLHGGSWYFRLESRDGDSSLEAKDFEQGASQERLELLAVVRGLEALDQPSAVTLVTSSRQVSRAVRQGLEYWRSRDWKWERFGQKVPMKNGDLWKRIDAALQIHDVRCRTCRFDSGHALNRPRQPQLGEPVAPTMRSATLAGPHFSMVAAARVRTSDVSEVRQQLQVATQTCEQPHANSKERFSTPEKFRKRLPRIVFRPFIGVARRTANALQVLADSLDSNVLQVGLQDAPAEPHLT